MKKNLLFTILLLPVSLFSMEEAPKRSALNLFGKAFMNGATSAINQTKKLNPITSLKAGFTAAHPTTLDRVSFLPQELKNRIYYYTTQDTAEECPLLPIVQKLCSDDEAEFSKIFACDENTILGIQKMDSNAIQVSRFCRINTYEMQEIAIERKAT